MLPALCKTFFQSNVVATEIILRLTLFACSELTVSIQCCSSSR